MSNLDPKTIAVKVSSQSEKYEVREWFKEQGYKLDDCPEFEDWPIVTLNSTNNLVTSYTADTYALKHRALTILTYSEWKEQISEKWVECIDGLPPALIHLEKYKVIVEMPNAYEIIDSCNNKGVWFKSRFRIVPAPSERKIIWYKHVSSGKYALLLDENTEYINMKMEAEANSFRIFKWMLESDWEPIYAPVKPEYEILKIGSKGIEVKVSKGKIEADGKEWALEFLKKRFEKLDKYNNHKIEYNGHNWSYEMTLIIGCSTFTREEIQKVIDSYNELNK